MFEAPNQVYCGAFVADGLSYSQIDWNLGLGGAAHLGCIQNQSRDTGQTSHHHRHSGGALTCWYSAADLHVNILPTTIE